MISTSSRPLPKAKRSRSGRRRDPLRAAMTISRIIAAPEFRSASFGADHARTFLTAPFNRGWGLASAVASDLQILRRVSFSRYFNQGRIHRSESLSCSLSKQVS